MKIKKFISLFASLAMMVTAVTNAINVSALSADDDEYFDMNALYTFGTCGDDATWLINSDCVLVIRGRGEMNTPYSNNSDKKIWGWYKSGSSINEIVVEEGITVGGYGSFDANIMCPYVSTIRFPSSLKKLNSCLNVDAINYVNLNDIYVYSKIITDASTLYDSYCEERNWDWAGSGKIWHVYKGSDTEKSLRNDLKLTNEDIEYIPDNEQMPTVNNKTAAEPEPLTKKSGPSGVASKWEWNEENKTLTFSGKGTISIANDYKKYATETEHIIIKSGIINISAQTGVIIGESISGAFYGFSKLNDVELPNTLRYLGDLSFYGVPITKIQLPEGLEVISDRAFAYSNLEDITFPESLNKIGDTAFQFCSKLKSINLHEGMAIGGAAFHSCETLKEITIPKNVKFLRTVYGAQGMSRQPSTFGNCTGLEKIIIEDGSWLGDSWDNEITPNGIPDNFCQGCSSLKTVIIKGDVEYISSRAFGNCTKLTDIYLYNTGLTTITAKGSHAVNNDNLNDPVYWTDSFWTGNDPTFHVVKGSITEQTMRNAGYLTADNTEYLTDFTSLNDKISEAEKLDLSKYTDSSVATLKSAIESGKTVLANENATQEQVDSAVATIENAIKTLKSKVSPAKPTSAPTTRNPETVKKDKAAAEKLMQQAKIIKLKVKSKAKKKITVSWKKVKNAVGYQVQVSKKSNFKKRILNKFTTKKKLTISKKIKSKKTYFVRVRAYATYKDTYGKPQKVYSKWNNKLRKVKVK